MVATQQMGIMPADHEIIPKGKQYIIGGNTGRQDCDRSRMVCMEKPFLYRIVLLPILVRFTCLLLECIQDRFVPHV